MTKNQLIQILQSNLEKMNKAALIKTIHSTQIKSSSEKATNFEFMNVSDIVKNILIGLKSPKSFGISEAKMEAAMRLIKNESKVLESRMSWITDSIVKRYGFTNVNVFKDILARTILYKAQDKSLTVSDFFKRINMFLKKMPEHKDNIPKMKHYNLLDQLLQYNVHSLALIV